MFEKFKVRKNDKQMSVEELEFKRGGKMKILVDEQPKEPKDCLFSSKTYFGDYVCEFQGKCICCEDTKKCDFLKRIGDYQFN